MDKTEILESDRAEGTPEKRRLSALPCNKNDHDWSNTALRIIFQSFQQKFWCSQFVVYHFVCFLFQNKNVDNQEINFQINSLIRYCNQARKTNNNNKFWWKRVISSKINPEGTRGPIWLAGNGTILSVFFLAILLRQENRQLSKFNCSY